MSYQESLSYLYGLQLFGIKLGLTNIQALVERMGNPQETFPIVHLAGTNGKGSTAAFLSTILTKAGFRTGLYTSPHLHSFCERIQVDGIPITEAEVVALTDQIRKKSIDIPSTFFEFTTVMALDYFRVQQVDIAILETGMGGRLDATNVVTPLLTVITPIDCDHQQYLGDTLAAIAAEKGGIIKAKVPVVLAAQDSEARSVIRTIAEENSSRCIEQSVDFSIEEGEGSFHYRGLHRDIESLTPSLPGRHQFDNAALALASVEMLIEQGFKIDDEAIRSGITHTTWPGRLEWVDLVGTDGDAGDTIPVLLDGAHNPQGARVLAEYLSARVKNRPIWIAGFKNDKLVERILAILHSVVSTIIVVEPPIADALPVETVQGFVLDRSDVICADSVEEALSIARRLCRAAADTEDSDARSIVVAGSLFLVAEARRIIHELAEVQSA